MTKIKENDGRKVGIAPSFPYLSPCPGEFPIICWGCFDISKERDLINSGDKIGYRNFVKTEISNIVDCGFNVAMRFMDYEEYDQISPYLATSNLNIIGRVPRVDSDEMSAKCKIYVDNVIQYCSNLDNLKAWMVGEEPNYKELDYLHECYYYIKRIFPRLMTFLTLSTSSDGKNVGFKEDENGDPTNTPNTYESYLHEMRVLFRPAVWCYDYYPIKQPHLDSEEAYVDSYFYRMLEMYSTVSKQNGVPFWAFCQCLQVFFPNSALGLPTVSRMRFEAFSALAYGAQGILYWSFLDRTPSGTESYANGPINMNYQRTETWDYVKQVNSEIKQVSKIFLGAEIIECKHTDNKPLIDVEYIEGRMGPILRTKATGDGVLVSLIENNGKTYFVIVSHDPDNEVMVNLILDMTYTYEVHATTPGTPPDPIIPMANTHSIAIPDLIPTISINRTLPPGGYLIFQYSKK